MAIKLLSLLGLAILNAICTLFLSGDIILPNLANLILILSILFSKLNFKQKPIGAIIFFLYLQFSLIWTPPIWYHLARVIELNESYRTAFLIGIFFQILTVWSLKLFEMKVAGKSLASPDFKKSFQLSPLTLLLVFMVLTAGVSWISYFLGVSAMGIQKNIQLPYKLEPLLNVLRGGVFPLIGFLIFLKLKPNQKYQVAFLTYWFFWGLFEVWAKGSKAFLLIAFFPMVLYAIDYFFFSLKKLFIFSLFIGTSFVTNYVIGDYLRENKMDLSSHNIERKNYLHFVLKEAYFRLFPDAVLIEKFEPLKPTTTNYDLFKKERGGPNIHTYILDKFPRDAAHNSGITGMTDGYLFAGFSGLLISGLALLSIFLLFDFIFIHLEGLKVLGITFFFHCLILGEGFLSYFFFRNPMTSLTAPIITTLIFIALGKITIKNAQNP